MIFATERTEKTMPNRIARSLPLVATWTRAAQRLRDENTNNRDISERIKETLHRIQEATESQKWATHSKFGAERIWNKLNHAVNKLEQKPRGAIFSNPKKFFNGSTEKRDSLRTKRILTTCEEVARTLETCLRRLPPLDNDQRTVVCECSQLLQDCVARIRSLESSLDDEIPTLKRRNLLATFLMVGFCLVSLVAVIAGPPGFGIIGGAVFASTLVSANLGNAGTALWLQWRPQKCSPWSTLKNAVTTFEQECDRLGRDIQQGLVTSHADAAQRRHERQLADLDRATLHHSIAMAHLARHTPLVHHFSVKRSPPLSQQATGGLPPITEGAVSSITDQQGISEKVRRISAPTSSREYQAAYAHIELRVAARARRAQSSLPESDPWVQDRTRL
jgi:hypothetical protein